ncbi:molybdopterin molybdotransferase MoeA [Marinimicrobium alkaliphilum]|uniref:molybdopterin molybdotransferase MoeA n=1 Tax=Marinimicrobium alkaliphilum TaxID=2202654 RepID=UPI000DB923AB|nr:gephyrin-like molybdotransferase Glp [Marinimicrobium alkaliphilum]
MGCCDEPTLLPVDEAITRMLKAVERQAPPEQVLPLSDALDRVLAQAVVAPIAVPGHDNSAMDGYALRSSDASQPLTVIGEALAGHPFTGTLKPGECVRIMTGAPLPAGADAVQMQENTQREGDTLTLTQSVESGANIRRRGEDITQGDTLLARGQRLGPVEIGLLASVGIAQVAVYRPLTVAILSTGDELVPPGQPLGDGQIYDSNRYAIGALLRRLNVDVLDLGLIPDEPDAIRAALESADARADAVISSGGVSVGDADYVKDILGQLGHINFWKVAIKPGKPFAFGHLQNSVFFGLPGNPVSALVTLHQLALPVLRTLAGEQLPAPLSVTAIAAGTYKKRPGRQDFQRARLESSAGDNRVTSNGPQGSGVMTSFLDANCYVVLEAERGRVEAGETVTVVPFDRFIQ